MSSLKLSKKLNFLTFSKIKWMQMCHHSQLAPICAPFIFDALFTCTRSQGETLIYLFIYIFLMSRDVYKSRLGCVPYLEQVCVRVSVCTAPHWGCLRRCWRPVFLLRFGSWCLFCQLCVITRGCLVGFFSFIFFIFLESASSHYAFQELPDVT